MDRPTYEELADAFAEYVAATSNEGGLPYQTIGYGMNEVLMVINRDDMKTWKKAVEQASEVLYAARDLRSLGQSRSARGKVH